MLQPNREHGEPQFAKRSRFEVGEVELMRTPDGRVLRQIAQHTWSDPTKENILDYTYRPLCVECEETQFPSSESPDGHVDGLAEEHYAEDDDNVGRSGVHPPPSLSTMPAGDADSGLCTTATGVMTGGCAALADLSN